MSSATAQRPASGGLPTRCCGFSGRRASRPPQQDGERAAVGWQTYRDGAAVDRDIAADWQQFNDFRRQAFRTMIERIAATALRPGLTHASAADTAWVIASPDTHHQLVRHAAYNYDQLEA